MDDRQLFALVARKVPVIWNAVGPASLNPQPLPPEPPPSAIDPLNPQPLPPGPPPELYGVAVGQELLRLSWQADTLGYDLSAASTWAVNPTPGAAPTLPPWLPQVSEPNNAWLVGYYLGLACVLAVAPEPATETSYAVQAFRQAVDALGAVSAAD